MRRYLSFSWGRAVGSAALLAVVAVVFVVLVLPATALGSKQLTCGPTPGTFDPTTRKGPPGKSIFLQGDRMGKVNIVWFKSDGGWTPADFQYLGGHMIKTWVPDDAVSGPIVVAWDDGCETVSSRHNFHVT